jgi:DNA-binding MarR family transcriptional regulator
MSGKKSDASAHCESSQCHCTALRKASRRISQLYDAALAPSGLRGTQRAILAEIGRSGAITVGKLANALAMDPGALAHTVKPLVRDHFVTVGTDPNDRRNRLISLTREGAAKLRETEALWLQAQRGFEAAFGRARSESLRHALSLMVSEGFAATFEESRLARG